MQYFQEGHSCCHCITLFLLCNTRQHLLSCLWQHALSRDKLHFLTLQAAMCHDITEDHTPSKYCLHSVPRHSDSFAGCSVGGAVESTAIPLLYLLAGPFAVQLAAVAGVIHAVAGMCYSSIQASHPQPCCAWSSSVSAIMQTQIVWRCSSIPRVLMSISMALWLHLCCYHLLWHVVHTNVYDLLMHANHHQCSPCLGTCIKLCLHAGKVNVTCRVAVTLAAGHILSAAVLLKCSRTWLQRHNHCLALLVESALPLLSCLTCSSCVTASLIFSVGHVTCVGCCSVCWQLLALWLKPGSLPQELSA